MMGSDIDGSISICDSIEHEGNLWLVPKWLENPTEGWKIPARMIQIQPSDYQALGSNYPAKHMLSYPIPTIVLNGETKQVDGKTYEVLEKPDIRIPITKGIH